jgi:hypothetical protein
MVALVEKINILFGQKMTIILNGFVRLRSGMALVFSFFAVM